MVAGCGSEGASKTHDDRPGLADASSDAGPSDDAAGDTATGDTTLAAACSAFRSFVSACRSDDACSVATAAQCEKFIKEYSQPFIEGMGNCLSAECTDDTRTSCIADHEDSTPTTAAQNRVRDAYCAVCSDDCDTFFDISGTSGAPGRADGQGAVIKHSADDVVAAIESACIPKLTASTCAQFFGCSLDVSNHLVAPDECQE